MDRKEMLTKIQQNEKNITRLRNEVDKMSSEIAKTELMRDSEEMIGKWIKTDDSYSGYVRYLYVNRKSSKVVFEVIEITCSDLEGLVDLYQVRDGMTDIYGVKGRCSLVYEDERGALQVLASAPPTDRAVDVTLGKYTKNEMFGIVIDEKGRVITPLEVMMSTSITERMLDMIKENLKKLKKTDEGQQYLWVENSFCKIVGHIAPLYRD
jgi:hypothetical protein